MKVVDGELVSDSNVAEAHLSFSKWQTAKTPITINGVKTRLDITGVRP